jgi:hypothetical protein
MVILSAIIMSHAKLIGAHALKSACYELVDFGIGDLSSCLDTFLETRSPAATTRAVQPTHIALSEPSENKLHEKHRPARGLSCTYHGTDLRSEILECKTIAVAALLAR